MVPHQLWARDVLGRTCPFTCLTASAGQGWHRSGAGQVAASGTTFISVRRRKLVSGAHGGFVWGRGVLFRHQLLWGRYMALKGQSLASESP